MPARPHRTVDRVTGILETVSLSPRGVTLAELAAAERAVRDEELMQMIDKIYRSNRPRA